MLDITFIRENPDIVKEAVKNKNSTADIDKLLELDERRRKLRGELDTKRAEQNRMNNIISMAKGDERQKHIEAMRFVKESAETINKEYDEVDLEWTKILLSVPNIPSPDTPIGKDEAENVVIRSYGEKPAFAFTPKPHWEIGEALGIIETQKAGQISGSRFSYIMGDLALLQIGLLQFVMKTLSSAEEIKKIVEDFNLSVSPKPFIPVLPPVMMKAEVMGRMARLQPIDERYYFEKDNMVFIGSAEHTLGPLHMDEIISADQLPIRYVGYSSSFRREAGAAGKDTRGILRQHQFEKIEMESFCRPEDGYKEQEFFVAIQEYLMQSLDIHYQVLSICTGDMGTPDQRQYDINTWMPGQNEYRETHTSDYMGGYQARRLNSRVRLEDGSLTHVHMNDATAFALGRILIAIIENYQTEDGHIKVPAVLIPYVGKEII
jgi:seryl-tRNA synthetase